MSWADATDEEEIQQPQRPSNAWQKPNPWAAPAQKKEEPKSSIVDDSDFPLPGKEKAPREQGSSNGKSNDDRRDDRRDERRDERRDDYRRRDDRPRDEYRREERRDDRPRDDYRPREDREDRGERRPYGAPRERREREFYGHDDREDRRSSDRDDDRFGGSRRGGFGKGGFNRREPREQRPREPREPVPLPTQAPFTAFVGNLPFTIVADQLHEFFSAENCKVAHIRIIAGNDGKPKGYGYVEFEDLESLKAAIELNGQPLFERELKIDVAEAKPKQEDRSSWKKRDSSPPRAESGNSPSEGAKERPKIALQPRSEAPKPAAPSDAYKSAKSNPFGEAKPRDENEILKKKEEERKQRETTGPKEAEEEVAPKTEEKPREEPFRPAVRKEDRPPRREDNRREDRPPRREDNRRDDRPPRRDDNRGPRRDDNRPPRRDDNRRDDRPPRRDDRPPRQPNNSTSVPAAKRAPWAPKQEEPKAVQSANIFGLLQEEDL